MKHTVATVHLETLCARLGQGQRYGDPLVLRRVLARGIGAGRWPTVESLGEDLLELERAWRCRFESLEPVSPGKPGPVGAS